MSESAAKANRRELRRAVGAETVQVISSHANNLETLRVAVMNLANRADAAEKSFYGIGEKFGQAELREIARPNPQTLRERLRWLVTGRC